MNVQPDSLPTHPLRILRTPAVCELVSSGRTALWRRILTGPNLRGATLTCVDLDLTKGCDVFRPACPGCE